MGEKAVSEADRGRRDEQQRGAGTSAMPDWEWAGAGDDAASQTNVTLWFDRCEPLDWEEGGGWGVPTLYRIRRSHNPSRWAPKTATGEELLGCRRNRDRAGTENVRLFFFFGKTCATVWGRRWFDRSFLSNSSERSFANRLKLKIFSFD